VTFCDFSWLFFSSLSSRHLPLATFPSLVFAYNPVFLYHPPSMKRFLFAFVLLASLSAFADEKPTIAVLGLSAGRGLDLGRTSLLSNRYTVILKRTGKFKVLPRQKVNSVLAAHGFDRVAYALNKDAATVSGKLLKVDYVIYGTVEKKDGKYWLDTFLLDVKKATLIRRVRSFHDGDIESFIKLSPASNIVSLLGMKKKDGSKPDAKSTPEPALKPKTPKRNVRPAVKPVAKPKPTRKPKPKPQPKPKKARPPRDWSGFMTQTRDVLSDRVEVGLRTTHFDLAEDEAESFLGSINELQHEQHYMPLPYVNVFVNPRWQVGLSYSMTDVITWTLSEPNLEQPGYTDGTIQLKGPSLNIRHLFKEKDWGRTFAEVGAVSLSASFSGNPEWQNARGHVDSHVMKFYDTRGYFFGGGWLIKLSDKVDFELSLQYMSLDVDMTYYLYDEVRSNTTFPLDNYRMGMGLQYSF
jgi:hypothetical protein